ncbi:MAG: peptidase [Myxococcaceae bacterium]|nr:peptidase [Myxococcaceae bacterium]
MFLIALVAWVNAASPAAVPPLKSGDIVLQASQSGMAESIRKATRSPYSHVGVIEVGKDGVFVVEAISPVSRTPFEKWRRRGRGGHLTVMRPRVSPEQAAAAVAAARAELGKPYDVRYGWGDDHIYCSELVVKAFERGAGVTYGERVRLDTLELGSFERSLAAKLGVPLSQEVVPPGSLASDPKLEVVFSDVVVAP